MKRRCRVSSVWLFFLFLCLGPGCPGGEPTGEADVLNVVVTGTAGDYTFAVTIRSPDTGCEQYADWWEVLGTDGTLLYRRILVHSHPDEQPFTRTGGPVEIERDTQVIVRAHMNSTGYGGMAMSGTPGGRFTEDPSITETFAPEVEEMEPQPDGCAF